MGSSCLSIIHYLVRSAASLAVAITATAGVDALAQTAPVTTYSGLIYQSLRDGDGATPTANDVVKVNYQGMLADGTVFDSSYDRHAPAQFPVLRVIPCWTEALQMMKVGGKARLTCPPEIAYGERGQGAAIPPNATLTFEVELLAVVPAEPGPE
jgi:FKBP-type peptidyl-prolyl cis-trans isomerase FkpA